METPCHIPEFLEGGRDLAPGPVKTGPRFGVDITVGLEDTELQRDRDESLLGAIVKVALEALPFLLPGLEDSSPRTAQLVETCPKLGLEPSVVECHPDSSSDCGQELGLIEKRRVVHQHRHLDAIAIDLSRSSAILT
jgi:predicted nuclease with RNAse H fold